MALQQAKRHKPFGGNKRDALKHQHQRAILNLQHEHEQVLALERALREGLQQRLKQWDAFPHKDFAEVMRGISVYDAIQMKLDGPVAVLVRWLTGKGAENWNDQITRQARQAREAMALAGLHTTSTLTYEQRKELEEHAAYYLDERGVHGNFRDLYLAVRAALAEIDRLRTLLATGNSPEAQTDG